ncbi:hypothetical protein [Streptomyces sp. NPDC057686]|uniref:hypothetical protein n=1 Tax=Streptomyces sp. NPDC057686 TaxID=3346212 RepID=UPI00368505CB
MFIDDTGKRIDRWEFAHTKVGSAKTAARLPRHGEPRHAMRARWGASKAKTNAGDSTKLADCLRTDGHMFAEAEAHQAGHARSAGPHLAACRPC